MSSPAEAPRRKRAWEIAPAARLGAAVTRFRYAVRGGRMASTVRLAFVYDNRSLYVRLNAEDAFEYAQAILAEVERCKADNAASGVTTPPCPSYWAAAEPAPDH